MALFGSYSASDIQKVQIWVESIHDELNSHVFEKSRYYNFDFKADAPHTFPCKFEWDSYQKHTQYTKRSLFNRSTATTLDIDELHQAIPDIYSHSH